MAEDFKVTLRIPPRISAGDIIELKAKIKHPSRTGLQLIETATTPYERFLRNQPAEFIRTIEVYLDGELVNVFLLNSSSSDDPLIAFKVRADEEMDVHVVVTNYLDEVVEASDTIKFSA